MTLTGAPSEQELLEQLRIFEGQSVGPPFRGPDSVNQAMIRHWVEAMGDENPVYVDEEAALANGFPGVVAPPTMLQSWIMRGYRATAELEAARRAPAGASARDDAGTSAQDRLFGLLDGAGFTSVVATNCDQTYVRPLELGDHVTASSVIESVSGRKATALGEGHFVTTRTDFTDDRGELVGTMRFRILRFRPRPRPAEGSGQSPVDQSPVDQSSVQQPKRPTRPRPAITQDNAFFFAGTRERKLLVQRCASCGLLRHPPRPACPQCRSFEWDTVESAGRGAVYSFVVVHHPQVPAFEYPLPITLVELDEGTRIVADLVDVDPKEVRIGMPVVCDFLRVDDELTLPVFRPAAKPDDHAGAR